MPRDVHTTQRAESVNSALKRSLGLNTSLLVNKMVEAMIKYSNEEGKKTEIKAALLKKATKMAKKVKLNSQALLERMEPGPFLELVGLEYSKYASQIIPSTNTHMVRRMHAHGGPKGWLVSTPDIEESGDNEDDETGGDEMREMQIINKILEAEDNSRVRMVTIYEDEDNVKYPECSCDRGGMKGSVCVHELCVGFSVLSWDGYDEIPERCIHKINCRTQPRPAPNNQALTPPTPPQVAQAQATAQQQPAGNLTPPGVQIKRRKRSELPSDPHNPSNKGKPPKKAKKKSTTPVSTRAQTQNEGRSDGEGSVDSIHI